MVSRRCLRPFGWLALGAVPFFVSLTIEARQGPADFFEAKVRPVLATNCYDCHTDQRMGGLRVDSREALLKGGRSGPAIVPGDPDKSLLIVAVRQAGALKMPKGGVLRPDEVTALADWIRAGAKWGDAVPTATAAATPAPAATTAPAAPAYVIKPEQRAFWSSQPLKKPPVPAVSHATWAKTDLDRFVLARLDKEGLTPVRAADKRTLIRRATLDLTGLPPSAEDIEAFEKDE